MTSRVCVGVVRGWGGRYLVTSHGYSQPVNRAVLAGQRAGNPREEKTHALTKDVNIHGTNDCEDLACVERDFYSVAPSKRQYVDVDVKLTLPDAHLEKIFASTRQLQVWAPVVSTPAAKTNSNPHGLKLSWKNHLFVIPLLAKKRDLARPPAQGRQEDQPDWKLVGG
ncbi:hypothetical protein Bbelb_123610 [Branchiostoma belcheri]|nr:hypothetical protein Bbelb_123610 [Branchiostoma belcheri]